MGSIVVGHVKEPKTVAISSPGAEDKSGIAG
jgi:hypothetical protein